MNNKNFRQDLYYRLNEYHIALPPLRERKEDISLFVDQFIKDANNELNKNVENVSQEVLDKIVKHSWFGNARELRNTIRRAVLSAKNPIITSIDIPDEVTSLSLNGRANSDDFTSINQSEQSFERELILKALNECEWNKSKAAKILKMNERTFYRRIKKLGIQ